MSFSSKISYICAPFFALFEKKKQCREILGIWVPFYDHVFRIAWTKNQDSKWDESKPDVVTQLHIVQGKIMKHGNKQLIVKNSDR